MELICEDNVNFLDLQKKADRGHQQVALLFRAAAGSMASPQPMASGVISRENLMLTWKPGPKLSALSVGLMLSFFLGKRSGSASARPATL